MISKCQFVRCQHSNFISSPSSLQPHRLKSQQVVRRHEARSRENESWTSFWLLRREWRREAAPPSNVAEREIRIRKMEKKKLRRNWRVKGKKSEMNFRMKNRMRLRLLLQLPWSRSYFKETLWVRFVVSRTLSIITVFLFFAWFSVVGVFLLVSNPSLTSLFPSSESRTYYGVFFSFPFSSLPLLYSHVGPFRITSQRKQWVERISITVPHARKKQMPFVTHNSLLFPKSYLSILSALHTIISTIVLSLPFLTISSSFRRRYKVPYHVDCPMYIQFDSLPNAPQYRMIPLLPFFLSPALVLTCFRIDCINHAQRLLLVLRSLRCVHSFP